MDANRYLKMVFGSKVQYPLAAGMYEQAIRSDFEEMPKKENNILVIKPIAVYEMIDFHTKKSTEVFKAQSVFEIPVQMIASIEDLYSVFFQSTFNMFNQLHELEMQNNIPLTKVAGQPPKDMYKGQAEYTYHHILGL
jgi:hypothetical protein